MTPHSPNIPVFWCEEFILPLPEGHRFPMEKYRLLPAQLVRLGVIEPEAILPPSVLSFDQVSVTHSDSYLEKIRLGDLNRGEERRMGFPYSVDLVEREKRIAGATLDAARIAMSSGLAFTTAGGTHHAGSGRGEGFCVFNDIAIAARTMVKEKRLERVLIIDLDVHQGNGSAEIFSGDESVFTLSLHAQNNFPLKKEVSDRDVHLPDGIADREYLYEANHAISEVLEKFTPDLIFYQAGVDILSGDKLGRLNVSDQGCRERDRLVFRRAREGNIPVVVTMGGGYSELSAVVNAHVATFEEGLLAFS